MNHSESEQIRVAMGRMDDALLKIGEANKKKDLLIQLLLQPPVLFAGEDVTVRFCSSRNDLNCQMNTATPHFQELFQLLLRVLIHAQTERIAILEDLVLTESMGLAPLLGLQRTKLSDLDLPSELIRPRVIEPFTEEEPS